MKKQRAWAGLGDVSSSYSNFVFFSPLFSVLERILFQDLPPLPQSQRGLNNLHNAKQAGDPYDGKDVSCM